MMFKQFCINVTNPNIPDVETDEMFCDNDMKDMTHNVTEHVKSKLNFIDKAHIPYVEAMFDKFNKIERIFDNVGVEDVPDTLLNYVSNEIYGVCFNSLSNDKRSIIAVLTSYILIYYNQRRFCE